MAHNANLSPEEARKANLRKILTVTAILSIVTIFEFVIAFAFPPSTVRTATFLILTIVKAFYIVAEFMHLKGEVKVLIYAIVLPMAFVVWLVVALLAEGSFITGYR
jgi:cytochrome c oxidase subunit IV